MMYHVTINYYTITRRMEVITLSEEYVRKATTVNETGAVWIDRETVEYSTS